MKCSAATKTAPVRKLENAGLAGTTSIYRCGATPVRAEPSHSIVDSWRGSPRECVGVKPQCAGETRLLPVQRRDPQRQAMLDLEL